MDSALQEIQRARDLLRVSTKRLDYM
ncbi:unnamed protein product, partial [Allacma fusca]